MYNMNKITMVAFVIKGLEKRVMIQLVTERLVLQDYQAEDFTAYFQLKSHGETMRYLQDIQLYCAEEAQADFAHVLQDKLAEKRKYYFFNLLLKDAMAPIGSMGYTVEQESPVGKFVHAGYFMYPEFWGKGYGTESFRRLLEFAFCEQNVYRLSTGCLKENIGSERIMQKCGLVQEAEKPAWQWHDGQLKTRVEYRLLRPEWQAMQDII